MWCFFRNNKKDDVLQTCYVNTTIKLSNTIQQQR
jgi:hypothetical protein